MITSPLVAQRIADLHQGDQRAAAARSRLSRQACSTRVAGTRSQRTFAGQFTPRAGTAVAAALFGDLTDDERDELLEYLAWYRARQRSRVRNRP